MSTLSALTLTNIYKRQREPLIFSLVIVNMLCNELLYMLYYDTFWADCDPTLTFCFLLFYLKIRVISANKDYQILHFYQMIKKIRKNKQEKKSMFWGFVVHSWYNQTYVFQFVCLNFSFSFCFWHLETLVQNILINHHKIEINWTISFWTIHFIICFTEYIVTWHILNFGSDCCNE